MKKGQTILSVVMWATGISLAFVGGIYAVVSGKFDAVNKVDINQEGRLSAVEENVKRIPYLEAKIDKLLENRGIRFNELQTNIATTTYDGK
jgi:hypothetical protein